MSNNKLAHDRLVRGIAKGAGVVFISTLLSRILGYVVRVLIARGFGPESYGLVSTSLAIFTMFSSISLLGFDISLTRQVSFFLKRDLKEKISSIVASAFSLSTALGSIFTLIIFIFNKWIAINIFDNTQLIPFIKYFSISILFYIWLQLAASVYRSFKQITLYVLFKDLFRFVALTIAITIAVLIHSPSRSLGLFYLISYGVVSTAAIVGIFILTPLKNYYSRFRLTEMRDLFHFSWPLMMANIISILLYRVDILMIGYFMTQTDVGIYNSALPIGELLTIIIKSFTPFLLPIMTEYYAQKNFQELDSSYSFSTKWIFILTVPLFSLMFLFPKFFVLIIFGKQYIASASVLRVIAVGFFFSTLVGPTGNLLTVIGKTKLHLVNSVSVFLINLILNYILIPKYGIVGGAIATATSLVCINIITLVEIYLFAEIQPFTLNFLKIGVLAFGLAGAARLIHSPSDFWQGLLTFSVYALIYIISLFLTKTFNDNDSIIFHEIEKRIKKLSPFH